MCLHADVEQLQRVAKSATTESMTSPTPRKMANIRRDVILTSSRPSSSSSLSSTSTTGSMLTRRRGLVSTPLPTVLRIALAPPTAGRALHRVTEGPPTSLTVDTLPTAVNLITAPGVGNISSTSTRGSRPSTKYRDVNYRVRTTATYTAGQYSAVLSVTDLIGKIFALLRLH